jgi:hypothetical protein
MDSQSLVTAKKFINLFATLDVDTLSAILAENYSHEFAPASVNIPGPKGRTEFVDHFKHLSGTMAGFAVYPKEYIENKTDNQITVWATSKTNFHAYAKDDGIPAEDWEFQGEYLFVLWMDESGEKITRCLEFLDSKKTDQLKPLMMRAGENAKRHAAASSS